MKIKISNFFLAVAILATSQFAYADIGTAIIGSIFGGKTVKEGLQDDKKAVYEQARISDNVLFDFFVESTSDTAQIKEELKNNGYELLLVNKNRIQINHVGVHGLSVDDVNTKLSDYATTVGTDLISKTYVNFAKSRGNHVVLYRPAIGYKVRKATELKYTGGNGWTQVERSMVEYDKNNEVVSMMERYHVFYSDIVGVTKTPITEIIIGRATAARFQDSVKVDELREAMIREM